MMPGAWLRWQALATIHTIGHHQHAVHVLVPELCRTQKAFKNGGLAAYPAKGPCKHLVSVFHDSVIMSPISTSFSVTEAPAFPPLPYTTSLLSPCPCTGT